MKKHKRKLVYLTKGYTRALIFTSLFIVIGCILGNVLAFCMKADRLSETHSLVADIFLNNSKPDINKLSLFFDSLKEYTISLLFIRVCSFSVYLVPVIFGKLIYDGFKLGLSSGIIVKLFGLKGFLFSGVSVFLENIIYIPVLVFAVVFSIQDAVRRYKGKIQKTETGFGKKISEMLIILTVASVCAVIDGYVLPYITLNII